MNLRVKTLKEKGLSHALKKAPGSKKRKKNAEKETNGETTENGTKVSDEEKNSLNQDKKKENKEKPAPTANNGIKNASTASLTRKVLEEQEERNKRRKLAQNDNVNSLFNKSDSKPKLGNSADYMTRGFSIGKK